jgi:hypothetical protein
MDKFPAHVTSFSNDTKTKKTGNNNNNKYNLFKTMGRVSNYSCLMPWHVEQHSSIIIKNFDGDNSVDRGEKKGEEKNKKRKTINYVIDATSHIGCDTILLSQLFLEARISAIENDLETFKKLSSNIDNNNLIDEKDRWRIDLHFGNALSEIPKLLRVANNNSSSSNILIYFDPPWGGPDYLKEEKMKLYLIDDTKEREKKKINILEVIFNLLKNSKIEVLLKIPFNFDFSDLDNFRQEKNIRMTTFPVYKDKLKLEKVDRQKIDYQLLCFHQLS